MATYTTQYLYYIDFNEESTTLNLKNTTEWVTDNEDPGSDTFSVNESVVASRGSLLREMVYIGHYQDGIIVYWEDASGPLKYIYLSNTAYDYGTPISIIEDSFVTCFLAGTLIATPAGEVAIETLRIGDAVLTSNGTARPVRWLARQTVSTLFADSMKVMPVRIEAGALGDSLPARDLFVSPDHALLVDGVLVQAGALVNGVSIVRHAEMPKSFTYYHVELADHSLILAEGVPAETFVDNVTRRRFDNWQEAPEAPIAELDLPRVKSARQLPAALRARLAERLADHLAKRAIETGTTAAA
ncbi:Hint domain-containing protein [Ancylobacter sp. Lp-2]|uniref:Hint domain-containing protein n=1 Tax=Ancylobacter sp. Lp-2 TaxID=2881339 RepID=UPI001E5FB6F8|nr:Hint domain-containing protein [Ancylobacter sp. Lp-2]MCB4771492.1 Hint domain-containing protein [Ancylobacter sp. Lp-2]